MARRGIPFDTESHIVVVGPLTTDALERIPENFHAWAASPSAAAFRFRRTPTGWVRIPRRELRDRVERSIVRTDEDLDLVAIERLARELDYSEFASRLILTPRFVAPSLSHAFGDGTVGLGVLRAFLSGVIEPEGRQTRIPVLRALAATGQLTPSGLRAGREFQRAMHGHMELASRAALGQRADASTVTHSHVSVDAERLRARVALEREESGLPVSTLDVLSGLIFRAFRACLDDENDLPVRMLVGLRRYLPRGLTARGNLAANAVLGTLRTRQWTAADAREAITHATSSPTIVASHAVEKLGHARARFTRRRGAPTGSPLVLSYSVLSGRLGADRDDFVPGERQLATLVMLNRGPVIGPHCTLTATGSNFLIATVDDSGILDLDRFAAAFEAELGNTASTGALGLR